MIKEEIIKKMVTEEWKPITTEEESKATAMEREYAKAQGQKELAKRKKQKEAEELENLRRRVEMAKKGEESRKESVSKMQEKAKLQKELSELKTARYKAVGTNVKNIFGNIGKGIGAVGTVLMGDASKQSQNVTRPAQAIQRQVVQPVPVQTQTSTGFQMPDFDAILGIKPQSSYTPSVRARIQIKRKSRLKRRMKGALSQKRKRTIPRIRRISRMPRSPTITQQKPFNLNDVLRGMPQ